MIRPFADSIGHLQMAESLLKLSMYEGYININTVSVVIEEACHLSIHPFERKTFVNF